MTTKNPLTITDFEGMPVEAGNFCHHAHPAVLQFPKHSTRPYDSPCLNPMAFVSGTRLGPYEVTGIVGAGGMGDVYRALVAVSHYQSPTTH
jgi:hypothetical protein